MRRALLPTPILPRRSTAQSPSGHLVMRRLSRRAPGGARSKALREGPQGDVYMYIRPGGRCGAAGDACRAGVSQGGADELDRARREWCDGACGQPEHSVKARARDRLSHKNPPGGPAADGAESSSGPGAVKQLTSAGGAAGARCDSPPEPAASQTSSPTQPERPAKMPARRAVEAHGTAPRTLRRRRCVRLFVGQPEATIGQNQNFRRFGINECRNLENKMLLSSFRWRGPCELSEGP
eukprot:scaffold6217_cov125-Isochrysis_galbana.AAC.1